MTLREALERREAARLRVESISVRNIATLSHEELLDLQEQHQKALAEFDAAVRAVCEAREAYGATL